MPDTLNQIAQNSSFRSRQVRLFVLVEEDEEMEMASVFEKQIEVAISRTLALPTTGVGGPCFPDSTKSGNEPAALRITQKVLLNPQEHIVRGSFGQFLEPPRKPPRLDKYHSVLYTTLWEFRQGVLALLMLT